MRSRIFEHTSYNYIYTGKLLKSKLIGADTFWDQLKNILKWRKMTSLGCGKSGYRPWLVKYDPAWQDRCFAACAKNIIQISSLFKAAPSARTVSNSAYVCCPRVLLNVTALISFVWFFFSSSLRAIVSC